MKKILYTRPDGGVSIVTPLPKENIEVLLGPLTEDQYVSHIIERSIPDDATNVRYINNEDIPTSRHFRNAWVDTTEEAYIDICCEKARDVQLEKLRRERDAELDKLDKEFMIALEREMDTTVIKKRKQELRDATNPLKILDVAGKVNDDELLEEIKSLGILKK